MSHKHREQNDFLNFHAICANQGINFIKKPFMVIYRLVFTFALLNLGKLAIIPGISALKH
jgi:hypothetical protein